MERAPMGVVVHESMLFTLREQPEFLNSSVL
jgi:hypothetical protein